MKNVRWEADRPIILKGFDEQHLVEDVTFDHCSVAGQPMRSTESASFQVNEYVCNLTFKPSN